VLIAGPQHQGRPQQERVLTNIELCLDLSGSMTAGFGSDGTRYDGAMAAIEEFTRRREGDAFGLTVFGNEVMRWTPLTQDLAVVRDATPWLRPERMPHQFGGTEIGKALNACLATITKQGSAAGDRLVVLLSDGQSADLGDEQVQSLVSGYSAGNVVFCMVFIGEGAPQSQLYTLANATGGVVVSGGDPAALRECFAYIDRMQPVRLAPKASQPVDQRWPWALGGLVLIALHGVSLLGLRNTPW
jgi:Ca-activated chloride channel family protein